ncbi:MAG TPA: glycosyltransferase [Candidatus Dormibacteraeota bacterium]|nr:glycosyltransferase [Candidatus Dormibacteraeota bacterium]
MAPGWHCRSEPDIVRTAFASTYPPRQCGIATFTGDLGRVTPDREIIAIHPAEPIGAYAFEVHHRIRRDERDDYARTARTLERCADVVAIQFQEGIWGGDDGEAVLDFVGALALPYVVTLHTLHRDPSPRQREILVELLDSAGGVTVMSHAAAATLQGTYGIDPTLIAVIRYGVPDLPVMADTVKTSVGLDGRRVLLSFGLLDPGKGYELVIDALPAILAKHPTTTYVIVGATHPDVRRRDGEAYRISLARRAAELGVAANVRFVPEFVGRVELARWLQAADVFITPNPDLDTMVSGTLSLAMAAGRAIVSTPYPYAVELLADGRGMLAPPTAGDLASAVTALLDDAASRIAMGAQAHEHSRSMVWTKVGAEYQAVFARVAASGPMIARGRTRSVATPR